MINEKEIEVTWQQRILGGVQMLLRGGGWLVGEGAATLHLFGLSPMFWEFALAVVFLIAYLFPGEEVMGAIARVGTELAIPFLLGIIYSTLNMIEVIGRRRDARWWWAVFKVLAIPVLDYLVFANQAFHRFIGWGDPAATWRSCVWFVWLVVLANIVAANLNQRISQR